MNRFQFVLALAVLATALIYKGLGTPYSEVEVKFRQGEIVSLEVKAFGYIPQQGCQQEHAFATASDFDELGCNPDTISFRGEQYHRVGCKSNNH